MRNGPQIVTNGLVLTLDSADRLSYPGSGTSWFDLSSGGINATGNASYVSYDGAIAGASWTTGTTSILNTDTHSIFFMLRLNSTATYPNAHTGSWEKIFSYNAGGSDRTPGVWRYPSSRLIHWRYDPGNTGIDFGMNTSATEFAINTWYHVGVTKNGASALAYVNGVNVTSATVANPKTAGNSTIIVNEYYTNPLNNVNCVMVYNRVITATEISQNFNALRSRFGI